MKPINKIALELLLTVYKAQRNNHDFFSRGMLEFSRNAPLDSISEFSFSPQEMKEELMVISQNSVIDLKTSFEFLIDEGLIRAKIEGDTGTDIIHHIQITSDGIKTIEGIETEEYKEKLENHFHIKLAENITLESLVKGSIL